MANFIELAQTDPSRARKRLNQMRSKSYFEGLIDATIMLLAEDDICIEIGSGPGELTTKLANSNAKVFCFEPDPLANKLMVEQFKERQNIEIRDLAVTTNTGKTQLFRHKNFEESKDHLTKFSSTSADNNNIAEESINVNSINIVELIDEVYDKFGKISFLMIDANGAEYEILQAMKEASIFKKIRFTFAYSYQKDRPEKRPDYKFLTQEFEAYPEWHVKMLKA